MTTLVGGDDFTLVDLKDTPAPTVVISTTQPLQQSYDKNRTPAYFPNRTDDPCVVTIKVLRPATPAPEDISLLLTNIKWGSTEGGNEYVGSSTHWSVSGRTFTVATNGFVTATGTQAKEVFFQADYVDPYSGLTQTVSTVVIFSVVLMGSDAVNVTIGGVTTIPKGLDVDVPEYGVVYASLFFGNAPETSGVTYQWRVGPDYGTSDILDANHPLVTSGAIKFKSTTAIAANDFTETGGLIAANADGNNFGNQRGLVIYENAVAGSLLLQCTAKITSGSQFEGYKTIVDKNDTYSISMISTAGAALKNGAGSTYIYARVFNGATEIKNLMSWQWRWTMLHSDGSRGAFVSSGETKTITSHTTGSGAVFTLQGVFATLPAIGSIIRVVKNHVIRYYVIAAITNTTNATITISTDPTTSAYDWINKDDHPDPTASEFAGGSLIECWDSYTRVLSFVAGGSFNCIADNSYDVTTGTFTTTASVAGVIAANDVIRLRHPTASNNCRFYQVLSVSGTAVTIKKTGITRRWITPTRYPYPINTDEMNGWYLQKITGVAGLPETGVSVGAQDVDIKSTFVCEVSKP